MRHLDALWVTFERLDRVGKLRSAASPPAPPRCAITARLL